MAFSENRQPLSETSQQDAAQGLGRIQKLPGFTRIGKPGKVRDSFVSDEGSTRVMITSDDLSAFDRQICRVPGKGAVLNELSYWWALKMQDIISHQYLERPPHPNVSIVENLTMIPVEFALRSHLAKSSSSTNLQPMYQREETGEIPRGGNAYGITLRPGIPAYGAIGEVVMTPTTKSEEHDLPLTEDQARALVDNLFEKGKYDDIKKKLITVYQRAQEILAEKGIILADTKFEVGINSKGEIVLADEILTPDNSRMWEASTYLDAVAQGVSPFDFSKEPTRILLKEKGYVTDGPIPKLTTDEIYAISKRYTDIYTRITGQVLPAVEESSSVVEKQIKQLFTNRQRRLRRSVR